MEEEMTEQDVQNWLDEYGRAWVNGDPDQVVQLFSETAAYRETPFDDSDERTTSNTRVLEEGCSRITGKC